MGKDINQTLKTYNRLELEDLLAFLSKRIANNVPKQFETLLYDQGVISGDGEVKSFNPGYAESLRQAIYKILYGYLDEQDRTEIREIELQCGVDSIWHWIAKEHCFLDEDSLVIQPRFYNLTESVFCEKTLCDRHETKNLSIETRRQIFGILERGYEKGLKGVASRVAHRLSFEGNILSVNRLQVRKKFNNGFPLRAIHCLYKKLDQEVFFQEFLKEVCPDEKRLPPSKLIERLRCSIIEPFFVLTDNGIMLRSSISLLEVQEKKISLKDIKGRTIPILPKA